MFNYLPTKFQNLVYGIILALTAYDVLNSIEDDIVFAINGDNRSTFLEFDNWGIWRYVFRIAVIAACTIALKKNAKSGSDSYL
jgi:hypothetical protein